MNIYELIDTARKIAEEGLGMEEMDRNSESQGCEFITDKQLRQIIEKLSQAQNLLFVADED